MRHAARLLLFVLVAQTPTPGSEHRPVRYVLDGDTIDVAGVGRVRLLGIDAPEVAHGLDTAAPFAEEAREQLRGMLVGRFVRLEFEAERRDKYGRWLAYVVRDDGLFVNAELLRRGLARVTARQPLRRLDELRRAERSAVEGRRGIWGQWPSRPRVAHPRAPATEAGVAQWPASSPPLPDSSSS